MELLPPDTGLMETVAEIAGSIGVSPGLTAFSEGTEVYCANLAAESPWPSYAREMVRRTSIHSVLSYGLRLRDHPLGVLTFYSAVPGGFDEDAQRRGSLLADHATIAIDAATSAERADSLKAALESSRQICAAMGVLAERDGITLDTAFDLLRVVSNRGTADFRIWLSSSWTRASCRSRNRASA